MDKKELLKKYWFIGVIAIALLVFVGIYAADAYKNREIVVNNKQTDGKYVAYTLDGEPVFADDCTALCMMQAVYHRLSSPMKEQSSMKAMRRRKK